MSIVAWVCETFGRESETFIYEPLDRFEKWRPVVLAKEWENRKQFPYPYVYVFNEDSHNKLYSILKNRLFYGMPKESLFLLDQLRHHQAKVIHAHFGFVGYEAIKVARIANLPLIVSFYGYDISVAPRDRYWLEAYQELFKEANYFCVEGPFMKERLMDLGCPEQKIHLIRIGINIENYPYKERKIAEHHPITILMAGRFVEKKGMKYGIRAVASVVNDIKDIELRIVGDGPLRNSLEDLVDDLKIRQHVKFTGFISQAQLIDEIYKAHIGLVPSVVAQNGDSEGGAPKVILEMQASGLPVVATTHADIPNVVVQNESAILVPERDVEALTAALCGLINSPNKWLKMGLIGANYIKGNFAMDKIVAQYEMLYSMAVSF